MVSQALRYRWPSLELYAEMDLHSRRRRRPRLDVAVVRRDPSCLFRVCTDVAITYAPSFDAAVAFWFALIAFDAPDSEQLSVWVPKCWKGARLVETGEVDTHLHVMQPVRVFGLPFLPVHGF